MDHINLKGMAFFGYHGDEPEETKLGQRFYIDVEMDLDLSRVGETDALEDSVNYVAVYEMVKKRAEGGPYKLLERLAGVINGDIMKNFPPVMKVITTVHKPGSPIPGILDERSFSMTRKFHSFLVRSLLNASYSSKITTTILASRFFFG